MERDEMSVTDVAVAAGTSRFNASAHLNRMAQAGLVACRASGTTHYYRIADPGLHVICDWVCGAVLKQAQSLARSVRVRHTYET